MTEDSFSARILELKAHSHTDTRTALYSDATLIGIQETLTAVLDEIDLHHQDHTISLGEEVTCPYCILKHKIQKWSEACT